MEKVDSKSICLILEGIAESMSEKRGYLIELDSVIGDGDLGITMEKGFRAASDFASSNSSLLPGEILSKSGMEIIKIAPSTMGTLMGSGLMYGGKKVSGKNELRSSDMVLFLEGFLEGVLKRGKAVRGDKTIVDVLYPAVEYMKDYDGFDIVEIMECALKGAKKGIEDEKNMISQHGKAAVFREKTIGLKDPGSEAVLIMIESMYNSICKMEEK